MAELLNDVHYLFQSLRYDGLIGVPFRMLARRHHVPLTNVITHVPMTGDWRPASPAFALADSSKLPSKKDWKTLETYAKEHIGSADPQSAMVVARTRRGWQMKKNDELDWKEASSLPQLLYLQSTSI